MAQSPDPKHPRLSELSLAEFAERLAARTPTPGGGSVAAYLAACGTALCSMAFQFTSGEKYARVQALMAARAKGLDTLRPKALELVDRDSAAYDGVTAAYALPKASEEEKGRRAEAVQAALRAALEVPFETMQLALAALRIAAAGAPEINQNLASDCAVGSTCLANAVESAFLNVRINASSIRDPEYVGLRLGDCEGMRLEARDLLAVVQKAVERHLA
jgi:methenyltetrahydrofolate cyclohydrolase